jgi:hypothetical protein
VPARDSARATTLVIAMVATSLVDAAPDERPRFMIEGAVTMSKDPVPTDVSAIPITFDARFVVRMKVERVLSGRSPWTVGSEQVFLIHSPARMFGKYATKGERFRVTFEKGPEPAYDRDCRYCVVGLERLKDDRSPKAALE